MKNRGLLVLIVVVLLTLIIQTETYAETAQVSVSVITAECSDGIDNDDDGEIDYPEDDGCESEIDYDETDEPDPECSDLVDNDGDGNIDFPDDLGCDSESDNTEDGEVTIETVSQIIGTPLPVSSDRAETEVRFQGFAYPDSPVTVSINGVRANTTKASPTGEFKIKIRNLGNAIYNFSIVAQDPTLRFSRPVNYSLRVPIKQLTEIKHVYLPPTIGLSQGVVKFGDSVRIEGFSKPNDSVLVEIPSEEIEVYTNERGEYSFLFDTSKYSEGTYGFISSVLNFFRQKVSGDLVSLRVVGEDEEVEDVKYCIPKGDINGDCKVNIVDFSIVAYWWQKELDEDFLAKEKSELNNDGVVDIVDFSIMAYYWTG